MNSKLRAIIDDYETYHRHPKNRLTHYFGIPMVVTALFGVLSWIELGPVNVGLLLLVAGSLWYLSIDARHTLPFVLFLIALYFVSIMLSPWILWSLMIVGWITQLYGHSHFEKNKPAFMKNILQLLVGPLWLYCEMRGL